MKRVTPSTEHALVNWRHFVSSDTRGMRLAKCRECPNTTESNVDLPFFVAMPMNQYDKYYCGCIALRKQDL